MRMSKEIADEFKKELDALFIKYNAEIELEFGPDELMIFIPSKWEDEIEIYESARIHLGTYYDGK